jgi:ribosomal protein S18 acetylase RimI-like enzyme
MDIQIREIDIKDATIISNAFKEQGWNKPIDLYLSYFEEQKNNERITLIAESDGNFAGYINIKWESHYPVFIENKIPEIMDFNVLVKYRCKGIGNKLIDRAEEIIKEHSEFAGIGVGLYSDYGVAQVMYIKRGYVPDGKGIYKNSSYINAGENIIIDDEVVLYLLKKLK